ncbi:hypothetical protein ACI2JA_03585 [Alkalihalobacillus sp. NPDC078783]
MSVYQFKGFDWHELAECWGVDDADDKIATENIRNHIWTRFKDSSNPDLTDLRLVANRFLDALIEEEDKHGYSSPLYRGLKSIEDDMTYFQWLSHNLEKLWT